MDAEPPQDYVTFVAARLGPLRREASRRCGDDGSTTATAVLTDLAGHWRRLEFQSRLHHRDLRGDYLERRLARRTAEWCEDGIQPVEVTVHARALPSATRGRPAAVSVAQRLTPLLPTTVRENTGVVAEAEIAWVHAYRRHLWHHYARVCAGGILLVGGLVHVMSQASGAG
ncbi:hypothetical protein [Couchioplanes caeruleus]|uniref:Uncharacterized protein n=2 Tax=Couchioplanes caeruleus TaxID=56438 RepID=A0A1K0GVW2_9ACTN|nr:hypothetical protein [Couchioplanes caeruleus]OJF13531.1 hypothetical protein BG844_14655 [Couchioplanes caeruleus subsp. caeruleus]ROP33242.1 hypothetical protein EDD30_6212 [Couchioplanes caeruleus]